MQSITIHFKNGKLYKLKNGDSVSIKELSNIELDPESWREENLKKQAAGVRFEKLWYDGFWRKGECDFTGKKEDYREVPQEDLNLKPTGDRWYEMQIEQAAIGVISSFNKWDRVLTEKEISDLFSGKVRPEDIPQEAPKIKEIGIEPQPVTPHAAERALWKAQREAGTNEVWTSTLVKNGAACEIPADIEPGWHDGHVYRVKPMKLTARIARKIGNSGAYAKAQNWEFTGTREEYRAECEKYGYIVISEIKEVKPKTVKYYFALIRNKFGTVDSLATSSMISFNRIAEKHCYTIIGDIEETEIEA